jgi:tetraacyldisaccharide 4'-kinase
LRRTDILLLTRTDLAAEPVNFERFVRGKQLFQTCHQPTRLYQLSTGEECALELLKGQHILAVCGIGNPEAFVGTLRQFEPKTVELLAFPDHHRYSLADLKDINARAGEVGADLIVTTEKDSQKLEAFAAATQFVVLEIELEVKTNLETLKKRLKQVITESRSGM